MDSFEFYDRLFKLVIKVMVLAAFAFFLIVSTSKMMKGSVPLNVVSSLVGMNGTTVKNGEAVKEPLFTEKDIESLKELKKAMNDAPDMMNALSTGDYDKLAEYNDKYTPDTESKKNEKKATTKKNTETKKSTKKNDTEIQYQDELLGSVETLLDSIIKMAE